MSLPTLGKPWILACNQLVLQSRQNQGPLLGSMSILRAKAIEVFQWSAQSSRFPRHHRIWPDVPFSLLSTLVLLRKFKRLWLKKYIQHFNIQHFQWELWSKYSCLPLSETEVYHFLSSLSLNELVFLGRCSISLGSSWQGSAGWPWCSFRGPNFTIQRLSSSLLPLRQHTSYKYGGLLCDFFYAIPLLLLLQNKLDRKSVV